MDPRRVVELAAARPWASQAWGQELLAAFPGRLARALRRWDLEIDSAHTDGVGLPVLAVRRGSALSAVMKFDGAGADLDHQVRVLAAAEGRGYARVLDHDPDLGAALIERLGVPVHERLVEPRAQVDVLAGLLEQAWELPREIADGGGRGEKATALLALLGSARREYGPWANRHAEVLDRAVALGEELERTARDDLVLVHGDPHAGNALARGAGYAFIDPEAFQGEREYDAGVVLREQPHAIAAGSRAARAARRLHEDLVHRMAERLELDADRVRAWAYLERVTTGVWLRRLGYVGESEASLTTARLL